MPHPLEQFFESKKKSSTQLHFDVLSPREPLQTIKYETEKFTLKKKKKKRVIFFFFSNGFRYLIDVRLL